MRRLQRFVTALLASFLGAVLLSQGVPGFAAEPTGAAAEPAATVLTNAEDALPVDPVARPENTLPTPFPEQPDGTLKLPPKEPDIPEIPGAGSEAIPAAADIDADSAVGAGAAAIGPFARGGQAQRDLDRGRSPLPGGRSRRC
jgi:hypothetical protein